ncbi:DUF4153 domain-containing protein [Cellulophaga baltica]|uniref:DUF4153 domain-containing protein n=1 Tax=Cellulophaga baltica TaxID=76594 RepID=UPI0021481322|nr:DUF4153 domain-containing protein [Cellulophaga baltica]MCR1023306.1 DUF4153 domain-containing protein [Cellulophaga baltica]
MKIPSISEITSKAQNAILRFTLALLWAVGGTTFFIKIIEDDKYDYLKNHNDEILTLIVGLSWLIGIQFFIEQFKNPRKWQWLKLIVLALLGLFYWYLPAIQYYGDSPIYLVRFFLYLIAGHLFLLFAPFIFKWDKNAYWNYLKNTSVAIIRSLFYSGILYLGLILALAAISALFDVHIKSSRYGQLYIFCLGTVNTWIYLSDFPKNIFQETTIYFEKTLEVLVKFILIPLVILYLLILYAYSAKIIIEWELPKGWVSYLVIALSFLGYIIQIIINPIQKELKSWTINKFYPWFYILLIPLNILLFIAILRRVSDYGITENRYFVLAIALWNVGIILYLLFRTKKALKVLPISLFIIAIVSSVGFWSAFSVSEESQIQQFEEIFTEVKNKNNVATNEEIGRLQDILDYLEKRKQVSSLNSITKLDLESFRDPAVDEDYKAGWLNTTKIWDSIAFEVDASSIPENEHDFYYSLYSSDQRNTYTAINDFDSFAYLSFYMNSEKRIALDSLYLELYPENNSLKIYSTKDDTVALEISLTEKLTELSKYGNNLNNASLDDLTIEITGTTHSCKLVLSELSFRKTKEGIELQNINAFLFLKQN